MGRMADRSVAAELGFLWRESGGELTWSVRAPDDGVAVTHEPGDRVVPSEPTAGPTTNSLPTASASFPNVSSAPSSRDAHPNPCYTDAYCLPYLYVIQDDGQLR